MIVFNNKEIINTITEYIMDSNNLIFIIWVFDTPIISSLEFIDFSCLDIIIVTEIILDTMINKGEAK